ncbi:hypothetical protein D3C73_1633480 [compost metagenome]
MVLQSTTGVPLRTPASTPSSLRYTPRTCAAAGSMVMTMSLCCAASRGELLICPPSSASSAKTVLFRSNRFS